MPCNMLSGEEDCIHIYLSEKMVTAETADQSCSLHQNVFWQRVFRVGKSNLFQQVETMAVTLKCVLKNK